MSDRIAGGDKSHDFWIVMEDGGYDGCWPLTRDGQVAGMPPESPLAENVVAGYRTLAEAQAAADHTEAEWKDRQDIYRGRLFLQKVTLTNV